MLGKPGSKIEFLLAVDGDVGVPIVVHRAVLLASSRLVTDRIAGVSKWDSSDVVSGDVSGDIASSVRIQ